MNVSYEKNMTLSVTHQGIVSGEPLRSLTETYALSTSGSEYAVEIQDVCWTLRVSENSPEVREFFDTYGGSLVGESDMRKRLMRVIGT